MNGPCKIVACSIYENYDSWKNILNNSPVRIQRDPEKDMYLQNLNYRSIQIGLTGIAVNQYVNEWTESITDITGDCQNIQSLIQTGKLSRQLTFF